MTDRWFRAFVVVAVLALVGILAFPTVANAIPMWTRWAICYAIAVAGWVTVVFGRASQDMYQINRRTPVIGRLPFRQRPYEIFVEAGTSVLLVVFTVVFALLVWSGRQMKTNTGRLANLAEHPAQVPSSRVTMATTDVGRSIGTRTEDDGDGRTAALAASFRVRPDTAAAGAAGGHKGWPRAARERNI
jgi:hypothetical protein